MDILKVLGGNLKTYREARGLSQKELAALMEIDQSQVSRAENGAIFIGLSTLERYTQVLQVEAYELFTNYTGSSDLDERIGKAVAKLSLEDKELLLLLIEAFLKRPNKK